jgi:hypothetical protein
MSKARGSGKVQLNLAVPPEVKVLAGQLARERGTTQAHAIEITLCRLASEPRP